MQLHQQKVELTETLRFSFLPAMSLQSLLHHHYNFSFPFTLAAWMWLLSFHSTPKEASCDTKEVNSKFVQHKATLTQLKKIPLALLNFFRQKLILGSAVLNPLSPGFDSHCRTISGAKINGNVEFPLSAFSNWGGPQTNFPFFCPLEGKLM